MGQLDFRDIIPSSTPPHQQKQARPRENTIELNDTEAACCGKRMLKEENFAKFLDLPKELRIKIWENCLEAEFQYRIVISDTTFSELIFPTRDLACVLLSVNDEARKCALAHFTTAVTVYHSRNFSLRWGYRKAEPGELLAAGRVHLRLEDDYFIPPDRSLRDPTERGGIFPNLERIWWVYANFNPDDFTRFLFILASSGREKLLKSHPCKLSFILSKEDSLKATSTTGLIDRVAIKPGWS
ncbi:hypothetical protein SCUP515_05340 [Seiridium cupressi]